MMSLIIAGQMSASLFLDHFGWLGFQVHPVSGLKMLGVVLLLGGVVLIRLF
jgi:transporter family-2 protein